MRRRLVGSPNRCAPALALAVVVLAAAGCATRGNTELLEAELRRQEDQLYAIQAQLSETESQLRTARQETELLRTQLAETNRPAPLPEETGRLARVSGVKINKLFSGGLDRDGRPGDEQVAILLTPHEDDGTGVKLPGHVELELIDLARPDGSRTVGEWRFDGSQTREHWHSGLAEGFLFRVPVAETPPNGELMVQARMVTPDGREFTTTQAVRVQPSMAGQPAPDHPPTRLVTPPEPDSERPRTASRTGIEPSSGVVIAPAPVAPSADEGTWQPRRVRLSKPTWTLESPDTGDTK
jgi:hypothetical protein